MAANMNRGNMCYIKIYDKISSLSSFMVLFQSLTLFKQMIIKTKHSYRP